MDRKKTREDTKVAEGAARTVRETVRKSALNASTAFELKKLVRHQEGFLDCTMEEEKESLAVTYDVGGLSPWTDIRREKRELMFAALEDVGKLERLAEMYSFSLAPENLYYDIQGRAYVKARDVYPAGGGFSGEEFLRGYRSLAGCTLTKKYKFEDYDKGGQELLAEDKFLKTLLECTEAGQVAERLQEEHARYRKAHGERFVEAPRAGLKALRAALAVTGVLAAAGAAFLGWLFLWERPYTEAVIAADGAYLQSDYSGTVEAMAGVDMERMDLCRKYILAYSCVRCESFSEENMKNILNTVSLNGDEKVLEYWICINRLDTGRAADIAMQVSNDQLLFYAYLKEKEAVEGDATLTGEEKAARLSDIEGKLKPLEEQFSELTEG